MDYESIQGSRRPDGRWKGSSVNNFPCTIIIIRHVAYMTSETEHEANLFVVLKGDILSRNSSKYLSAPLHLTGFSQINQFYLCRR